MRKSKTFSRGVVPIAVAFAGLLLALVMRTGVESPVHAQSAHSAVGGAAMPQYDGSAALKLPEAYRQWVFVGSSLGLSYSERQPGVEMFHETLMEPSAYQHFVDTGTFREGTMLALILHGTGEQVLPARHGRFAADVHGVEMAVKDTSHQSEGWAYYNFGGMNGLRTTAQAMPKESCYNCHAQHAKRDNVFLQFYPLLAEAAHLTSSSAEPNSAGGTAATRTTAPIADSAKTRLALRGLDPVLLVAGREELGKPEIIAVQRGLRYQFVSEPNRATFAADPGRFSLQNEMCPVVPSAAVDPSLFTVYDGRIWGFATSDCVTRFNADPAAFLKPPAR